MPLLVKQDSKKSNHVCCISLTRHEYINFMMQFMGLPPFSNSTIRILLKLCAKHKSRKNINLSKIQIITISVYTFLVSLYIYHTLWNMYSRHFETILTSYCWMDYVKNGENCVQFAAEIFAKLDWESYVLIKPKNMRFHVGSSL